MKTITITLTETESSVLDKLALAYDPSGAISRTSVAHGLLVEGMVRSAVRNEVQLPGGWVSTDAVKRYSSAVK